MPGMVVMPCRSSRVVISFAPVVFIGSSIIAVLPGREARAPERRNPRRRRAGRGFGSLRSLSPLRHDGLGYAHDHYDDGVARGAVDVPCEHHVGPLSTWKCVDDASTPEEGL